MLDKSFETDKPTDDKEKKVETETQTEEMKPTEKQTEQKAPEQQQLEQVHKETVPLATSEVGKLVLKEIQTQSNLPEVNTSFVTSIGTQIVGSSSRYKSTNVTKVLLDSIKKITNCSSQAYKAIDDTIPILKVIEPNYNIDNKDSLGQLDTLCKNISENIEKIKEDLVKDKVEIEK